MAIPKQYQSDVKEILKRRTTNGGDLWATADNRLGVGSPFSTLQCVLMLTELGMKPSDPILERAAESIMTCWREDGRFRLAPKSAMYPCHTATAARVLCRLGYASDERLNKTFDYLFEIQYRDGGWRCNKFSFGRGPETESSNPGPTLEVLDAFRFSAFLNHDARLDDAVGFLLSHWETRKPLGPCHFGIGTLFMKIEYPFFRYNLLFYVYVLSFYNKARTDWRFLEALEILRSKLSNNKIVVENPNRKLAAFSFCKRGEPSDVATQQYEGILRNISSPWRSPAS